MRQVAKRDFFYRRNLAEASIAVLEATPARSFAEWAVANASAFETSPNVS